MTPKKTKKPPKKNRRMTALVPRVVFSTVFVGVIPACAGAIYSDPSSSSLSDGGRDALFTGGDVAVQCFGDSGDPACSVASVAFQCFDGSTDPGCPPFDDAATDAPDDALDDADGAG